MSESVQYNTTAFDQMLKFTHTNGKSIGIWQDRIDEIASEGDGTKIWYTNRDGTVAVVTVKEDFDAVLEKVNASYVYDY